MASVFEQIEGERFKQYLQDIVRVARASSWNIFDENYYDPDLAPHSPFAMSFDKTFRECIDEIEGGVLVFTNEDESYEDRGAVRIRIVKKLLKQVAIDQDESWIPFYTTLLSKLDRFAQLSDRASFAPKAREIAKLWFQLGSLLKELQSENPSSDLFEPPSFELLENLREAVVNFHTAMRQVFDYSILNEFVFKGIGNYGESTQVRRLFLYCNDRPNLADLGIDYIALHNLYYCLFDLMIVPEHMRLRDEKSLAILDARFGSQIIDILGIGKVVEVLEKVLTNSVVYLRDKFESQSQIAQIPKDVQALDEVIGLRNKLNQAGVDTTNLDSRLQESAEVIATNLDFLLRKKSNITINGIEYSLGKGKQSLDGKRNLNTPIIISKSNLGK